MGALAEACVGERRAVVRDVQAVTAIGVLIVVLLEEEEADALRSRTERRMTLSCVHGAEKISFAFGTWCSKMVCQMTDCNGILFCGARPATIACRAPTIVRMGTAPAPLPNLCKPGHESALLACGSASTVAPSGRAPATLGAKAGSAVVM